MVGGKQDDGVAGDVHLVQLRQHPPELVVDLRLHAPGQRHGASEARRGDRVRNRHAALLDRRRFVVDPVGRQTRADIVRHPSQLSRQRRGLRHVRRIEQVGPRPGRAEGVVRIGGRDEKHERPFRALQESQGPVCDPGVVVQGVGDGRCPCLLQVGGRPVERRFRAVERGGLRMTGAEPLRIVASLGCEQRLADHEVHGLVSEIGPVPSRPESRPPERHRLRITERNIGHDGLQVQLPDGMRSISLLRQQAGQGRNTLMHGAPVRRHAVMTGIEPGNHRAAARGADLVRRQMVVEAEAAGGKRIDVRRPRVAVAIAAQAVGTLLIGAENNEIGPGHQTARHSAKAGFFPLMTGVSSCRGHAARAAPPGHRGGAGGGRNGRTLPPGRTSRWRPPWRH